MKAVKVMIVEDEAVIAMDIRYHLEQFGYKVVGVAATGLATINFQNLLGFTVESIMLELGGTALTKAMLTDINIKANQLAPAKLNIVTGHKNGSHQFRHFGVRKPKTAVRSAKLTSRPRISAVN